MLCFQFFIMHTLHNSDAKISSHLQIVCFFFNILLIFPKYYIILFLEATVSKWKRQTFGTYINGTSIQDWIWPFYNEEKKNT